MVFKQSFVYLHSIFGMIEVKIAETYEYQVNLN